MGEVFRASLPELPVLSLKKHISSRKRASKTNRIPGFKKPSRLMAVHFEERNRSGINTYSIAHVCYKLAVVLRRFSVYNSWLQTSQGKFLSLLFL